MNHIQFCSISEMSPNRLDASGYLVSVGDNTTDEVRLSLVQGGHQVIQLALEVGGDSLATLALLPVLVLWAKN